MENINFEWDESKNQTNQKKRGIGFEEAKTIFYDENAILFEDPEHSMVEDRFLILGISKYEVKTYNRYAGGEMYER